MIHIRIIWAVRPEDDGEGNELVGNEADTYRSGVGFVWSDFLTVCGFPSVEKIRMLLRSEEHQRDMGTRLVNLIIRAAVLCCSRVAIAQHRQRRRRRRTVVAI